MDIDWTAPIGSLRPRPLDEHGLVERLRLTVCSLGYALSMGPSLALLILTVVAIPLGAMAAGFAIALAVVPATAALVGLHRRLTGLLLGVPLPATYADDSGTPVLVRPARWITDRARWRDVALLAFSATGGFVLSLLPVAFLTDPLLYLMLLVFDRSWLWAGLFVLSCPLVLVWWLTTPALVRARATAERGILGGSRVAVLERRVEQVEESRAETLDHSAAEVRRIERDLHDGAQARIAAVGMSVGLAEKLLASDPDAAAALLREARETTVAALEDLRSVVRGIHPPVLADQGLAGAVQALAVALPVPVTVSFDAALAGSRLPEPVESALYFAVAECLANTVKHARAGRGSVRGTRDGVWVRIVVRDDGRGGADAAGSGLSGVARRLAAFDGTLDVESPSGGPTTLTMEVPCR